LTLRIVGAIYTIAISRRNGAAGRRHWGEQSMTRQEAETAIGEEVICSVENTASGEKHFLTASWRLFRLEGGDFIEEPQAVVDEMFKSDAELIDRPFAPPSKHQKTLH
jgi:hypothetical protein